MQNIIRQYCEYTKYTLGRSEEVVTHHYYNLKQFYEYVSGRKGIFLSVDDIDIKDCFDFIAHYRSTPIKFGPNKGNLPSQNTVCEKTKTLRVFFKYLRTIGYKGFDRELIPKLSKNRNTMSMMSQDEYKVLSNAPLLYEKIPIIGLRNHLIIEIAASTGLRRSEILRCTFDDFDSSNRQFDIIGKGGYVDAVFFTEKVRKIVLEYKKALIEFTKNRPINSNLLFIGLDNSNRGKKLNAKYVNTIMVKYKEWLMVTGKIKRNLTLHMLRHKFATDCVFSGLSQQATTKLMRHRDPRVTLRYYHLDNKRLKSEFDKVVR